VPGTEAFQQAIQPPRLTLITDTTRFSGESFFSAVQHALQGGVEAVLIREKQLTSAKLLALASRLRDMTHAAHARLIIHTQADIAGAVDADGVHLSSLDIASTAAVRQWLNDPLKTVSVSCHNAEELDQAAACRADFALLSPVYPTASHPGMPHLGIEAFQQLAAQAALPVVALGGIDTNNCHMLRGRAMAVISALLGAEHPELSARQLYSAATGGVV